MGRKLTKELVKEIKNAVYINNGFFDVVALILALEKCNAPKDVYIEAMEYMYSISQIPNTKETHALDYD